MIKKITLLAGILLGGLAANSQCSIGLTPSTPGAYPAALNDGCTGVPYAETVTIVFPLDTTVSPFGTIPLDSVVITGVLNVPTGLSSESHCGPIPCTAFPFSPTSPAKSCVSLTGIPTAAFSDSIEVTFELFATVPILGVQSFISSKKVAVTINTIDNTTNLVGMTITANETGATYRWLDCNNSSIAIPTETGVSYTATTSGDYAVEVTKNGCVDTSACVTVATVGVTENEFSKGIKLFPNPTEGNINLTFNNVYDNILVNVTDITGKSVLSRAYANSTNINLDIENANGVYFVEVSANQEKAIFKVIKR